MAFDQSATGAASLKSGSGGGSPVGPRPGWQFRLLHLVFGVGQLGDPVLPPSFGSAPPPPPLLLLPGLMEELEAAKATGDPPTERNVVERVILARLTAGFQNDENGLDFLMASFHRADYELRRARDPQSKALLSAVLDLSVSYSKILLDDASMFEGDLQPVGVMLRLCL